MFVLQQVDQGEGDRSSQSSVSDDKLVLRGQFDDTELVDHEGQADNTFGMKYKTLIKQALTSGHSPNRTASLIKQTEAIKKEVKLIKIKAEFSTLLKDDALSHLSLSNMCVCIYMCVCVCIYIYIYICVCVCVCVVCVYIYICVCVYIYMYVCVWCVYIYIYMCVCVCVCGVCVWCVCVYIYMLCIYYIYICVCVLCV